MPVTDRPRRAAPMAPDERRVAIARAAVPLIMALGRDVTTRQLAEAAGVAEGTLFRVFDDKDAIIDAAVAEFLDPEPFRDALRSIDPSLPLELKLELVIDRFHDRMRGIIGIFSAVGARPEPLTLPGDLDVVVGIFERLLAPDRDRLREPPERVFRYLRIVAFATSIPHFDATVGLDSAELAALMIRGVAHDDRPAGRPSGPPTDRIDESESS